MGPKVPSGATASRFVRRARVRSRTDTPSNDLYGRVGVLFIGCILLPVKPATGHKAGTNSFLQMHRFGQVLPLALGTAAESIADVEPLSEPNRIEK